jgi:uncharacterized membrane protein HdeD (DUF308 family)
MTLRLGPGDSPDQPAAQSTPKASMTDQPVEMTRCETAGAVRDHWRLYLIEGGFLVLLGVLAFFMPPWFGIALFGWLFLAGGIVGLVTTFVMWRAPGS